MPLTRNSLSYQWFKLKKKKNQKAHSLTKCPISGRFIFLKQALIDQMFSISVFFIISNSNINNLNFSYLTKLPSTFKGAFIFLFASMKAFKNDKNAFYFILKAIFVLMLKKQLDSKDKVNFKIYYLTAWLRKNYNTHIAQYLTK